ncbi:hypothetical protein SAMD00020551_3493 [Mesobacillus selenatarsenatis SF-1]|uniref:Uncharacterized protein n=1 Tax=Mesobacillus selenatarsenatis (strain DSM 18680 / JCM 14380 / FERM P-15431 / SF-1) TaxID=1321606 RepID=A0A0A8XB07_MESS1|nr:hypothetical protein SAMD00020551_3493 [Mesobacillus selenatarsenatis SF-1]
MTGNGEREGLKIACIGQSAAKRHWAKVMAKVQRLESESQQ